MKKLLLGFIFSIMVFVIGCQENTITEPEVSGTISKTGSFVETTNPHVINLKETLKNPDLKSKSSLFLNGAITYSLDIEEATNIDPISQKFSGTLNLDISAKLSELTVLSEVNVKSSQEWNISGRSVDKVSLTNNSETFFTKSFGIDGRNDNSVLVCTFLLSRSGVSLHSVKIEIPNFTDSNKQSDSN